MSSIAERILSEAASLSAEERVSIAYQLLDSIEPESQEEIDAAWEIELDRRMAEVEAGTMEWEPAEKVMAEMRAKYL